MFFNKLILMLKIKHQLVLIIFLIISGNITSQDIFDTLTLNEFEIIAPLNDLQSPTKVTSFDSISRKELSLHDMGELLSSFSPVYVKSYGKGSLATVSFRGTGASHTKVIWEGFNINSPMLGQTDFSTIPVSIFSNVELHYGGSSLTEIGGALGGSVKLETSPVNSNMENVIIMQSVGSYNTFLSAVTVNLSTSVVKSRTHFTRQSSKNDFKYLNTAILPNAVEMKQTNADFTNYGFTQQLDFQINENQKITATSWNQWNYRNIPKIMGNTEIGGIQKEYQDDVFSRNVIAWTINKKSTTWKAKAAYFYEKLDYHMQSTDSLDTKISNINSENKVLSYLASANVSTNLSQKIMLKAGTKYVNQEVISNNYITSKKRIQISNYAGLSLFAGAQLKAEVLIRSEISDGSFTPLMPMIGLNYKPLQAHNLFIRLNISRNYNLPSLNDLYWYPGGNDSLLPEESIESEISIDYSFKIKSHNITFRSTGYVSSVENWIIWSPSDFRWWTPQNIASVLSRGAEISLKSSGKIVVLDYTFFAEYSYTRATNNSSSAKDEGLSDIQLMYVPINNFNSFLNLSYKDYYLNWSVHYIDDRSTSMNKAGLDPYTLPAYTLNNISAGKRGVIKKVGYDIRFKVYNIFNVDYQAVLWRAMPGLNYEFSLSIRI